MLNSYKSKKIQRGILIIELLFFLVCFLVYFSIFAFFHGLSFYKLFTLFWESFYSPQYDLMFVDQVAGVNTYIFLIFFIAFYSVSLKIFHRLPLINPKQKHDGSEVFTAIFLVFLLVSAIQTINYFRLFRGQAKAVSGKTTEQKNSLMFGPLYDFPAFCHHYVSGKKQCFLLTGFDQKTIAGRHDYIVLTYYLYPLIVPPNPWHQHESLQANAPFQPPVDLYLIYGKNHPEQFLPKNFEIIAQWNTQSLLAQKRIPE